MLVQPAAGTDTEDGQITDPAPWPVWPQSSPEIEEAALRVLRSGRWAISGMSTGGRSEERAFGDEFAAYLGVGHGVPVTNGSAALVVALEALRVGRGDEVLVPGVVWVACASAVARVGARPVLVDVDEATFCMSLEAAEAAITDHTRAILLVHLYSSIADLDAFTGLAARHGLALLEDCAQAHGATWRGRRVGSVGQISAFSFQNSKLLTAGEGGFVATSDPALADAAQQLRGDGRRWMTHSAPAGFPDLDEVGHRQGHNHCMSELQAAVLRASLGLLDAQNARRLRNALALEQALEDLDGVSVVRARDPRITQQTFYHLPVRIDPAAFAGASGEQVGGAVATEVSLYLEPVDPPLNAHPLYRPDRYARFSPAHRQWLDVAAVDLPAATRLSATCFTIPHHALLAPQHQVLQLAEALARVQRTLLTR
jgi:dTDP-4-amino-4,6-dideoxygalactose transaminase